MERIVGRAELRSDESAFSSSLELEEEGSAARPLIEFEFVENATSRQTAKSADATDENDDEYFEAFRLPQMIVLVIAFAIAFCFCILMYGKHVDISLDQIFAWLIDISSLYKVAAHECLQP